MPLLRFLIYFLAVRLRQIKRVAAALPWWQQGLLAMAMFVLAVILASQSQKQPNVWVIAGLFSAVLFSRHLGRTDYRFLQTTGRNPHYFFLAEYVLAAFLFWLPTLGGFWYYTASVFISAGLIAVLPVPGLPHVAQSRWAFLRFPALLTGFIHRENFEWRSGLRRYGWALVALEIVAFAAVKIKFLSLLLFWPMLGVMAQFYLNCESREILGRFEGNARSFFWYRWQMQLKPMLVLFIPVAATYAWVHHAEAGTWLFGSLALAMAIVYLTLFVSAKYAAYQPNAYLGALATSHAFALACLLVPFLVPIPLLMAVRNVWRAERQLSFYLS